MIQWTVPGHKPSIVGTHVVLGTPLDMEPGSGQEVIFFAGGCFWGVEKIMWEQPGVVVTATGFMGGTTEYPTYHQVCTTDTGHAETVRVVFDTTKTSAEKLIATFFEIHDPTQVNRQGNDRGSQYRGAIWTTTPQQFNTALAIRDAYQEQLSQHGFGTIATQIEAAEHAGPFWPADESHQGYLWKHPDGYQCHSRTGVACPVVKA